jgi:hypothetical protein
VLVVQCENLLDKSFIDRYLITLTNAIFDRLLIISDEDLKREDKQFFHETATIVQNLLKRVMTQEAISRKIDQFNLAAGLRGIEMTVLEKRLKGVRLIKKQVQRAMVVKEEKRFDSLLRQFALKAPRSEEEKKVKPLDPQYVWFVVWHCSVMLLLRQWRD